MASLLLWGNDELVENRLAANTIEEKALTGLPVHCPVLAKLSLLPGHNDNPRLKIKGRWRIKTSFHDSVKMVV